MNDKYTKNKKNRRTVVYLKLNNNAKISTLPNIISQNYQQVALVERLEIYLQ